MSSSRPGSANVLQSKKVEDQDKPRKSTHFKTPSALRLGGEREQRTYEQYGNKQMPFTRRIAM